MQRSTDQVPLYVRTAEGFYTLQLAGLLRLYKGRGPFRQRLCRRAIEVGSQYLPAARRRKEHS